MATKGAEAPVLLLCSDGPLRSSLADLLVAAGHAVVFEGSAGTGGAPGIVVTAGDAWPAGWSLARLRSGFARVPCVMLSGSPLAGDFAVTRLARGYFLRLPALPAEILALVAELSAA